MALLHNNPHVKFEQSDSPLNFPVYERDLGVLTAVGSLLADVHSHKAIIRYLTEVTSTPPVVLGIVGKGYKVVQNAEIFNTIDGELTKALKPEQMVNMQIKDSLAYHGAWCTRQYIFPDVSYDIEYPTGSMQHQSKIAFRIIVIHSFDGSSSLKTLSGAIDFFCTNGTIRGQFDTLIQRHTSGLSLPRLGERIAQSIQVFWLQRDVFKRWAKKQITDSDAENIINNLPDMSERRAKLMLDMYKVESVHRGQTVWALYSALTYYSSHNSNEFPLRKTGEDHAALSMHRRELQVAQWVESDAFRSVAGDA